MEWVKKSQIYEIQYILNPLKYRLLYRKSQNGNLKEVQRRNTRIIQNPKVSFHTFFNRLKHMIKYKVLYLKIFKKSL